MNYPIESFIMCFIYGTLIDLLPFLYWTGGVRLKPLLWYLSEWIVFCILMSGFIGGFVQHYQIVMKWENAIMPKKNVPNRRLDKQRKCGIIET